MTLSTPAYVRAQRANDQLRAVRMTRAFTIHAEGSLAVVAACIVGLVLILRRKR